MSKEYSDSDPEDSTRPSVAFDPNTHFSVGHVRKRKTGFAKETPLSDNEDDSEEGKEAQQPLKQKQKQKSNQTPKGKAAKKQPQPKSQRTKSLTKKELQQLSDEQLESLQALYEDSNASSSEEEEEPGRPSSTPKKTPQKAKPAPRNKSKHSILYKDTEFILEKIRSHKKLLKLTLPQIKEIFNVMKKRRDRKRPPKDGSPLSSSSEEDDPSKRLMTDEEIDLLLEISRRRHEIEKMESDKGDIKQILKLADNVQKTVAQASIPEPEPEPLEEYSDPSSEEDPPPIGYRDPLQFPTYYPSHQTEKNFTWSKHLPTLDTLGDPSKRFLNPPIGATPSVIGRERKLTIKSLKKEFQEMQRRKRHSKPRLTDEEKSEILHMLRGEISHEIRPKVDFVYHNARKNIIVPPKRPDPVYIDDRKGTRHQYCPSGLARHFIYKEDYGQIPEYLQKRNVELGRPAVPDFRKFYKPHICKHVFGHYHCQTCRGTHKYHRQRVTQGGDYGQGGATGPGGRKSGMLDGWSGHGQWQETGVQNTHDYSHNGTGQRITIHFNQFIEAQIDHGGQEVDGGGLTRDSGDNFVEESFNQERGRFHFEDVGTDVQGQGVDLIEVQTKTWLTQ